MKERLVWMAFSFAVSVIAGVLFGEVNSTKEALDYGWTKYLECMVTETANYAQTCQPKGTLCSRHSDCCSGACTRFRCQ